MADELRGAYRRHSRADEHLTDLQGVIERIQQLGEYGVLAEQDPDTGEIGPSHAVLNPLKLDAGVLVAEIVHNLRAALDYLVYVLAESDAGTPQSGTQFLIEDSAQGFTGRSPRLLVGVSDEHVAIIRQFQPFKGCEWTGILRELDNASKHREVLSVGVDLSVATALQMTEYVVGGELDADGNPPSLGVEVYLKGPVEVLLPDRRQVVDTLRYLHTQVGNVLGLFVWEFPPAG
jgi:hypothetical protein